MGLAYDTGRWPDSLWQRYQDKSPSAHKLVGQGRQRQERFPGFAQDVHSRLYLHHEPSRVDNAPSWATSLHDTMSTSPEYRKLKARCANNGFLAGVATESMLQSLLDSGQIPQQEKGQDKKRTTRTQNTPRSQPDTSQQSGEGDTEENNRALRRAMRQAVEAADSASEAVDGFLTMFELPGSGVGNNETLDSMSQVIELYEAIRYMSQLREIAELAGRLQRIARTQKRVKVSPAVGGVKGVTLGNDLARLLPSELVGLRSPNRYLRLQTLQKIQSKQALQYLMEGEQPQGRGPVILCCDESASMSEDEGKRAIWAKAIALALLATATEQKRHWWYIGFNSWVTHEAHIAPGEATLDRILSVLTRRPSGGTDFDRPLSRALHVLNSEQVMRKADIVFLTDGVAGVSPGICQDYARAKQEHGLSVYAVGVGMSYGSQLGALEDIPTAKYHINDFLVSEAEQLAPALQCA